MTLSKNGARAMALAAAVALTTAACGGGGGGGNGGGGGGAGGQQTPGAQGKPGGTLNLLMVADFEHIDPQRTYVATALNFTERFTTRTLVAFDSKPGPDGSKIVPDMATDLGKASDGNKTWTFTLKDGLKFEDGSPIRCEDIKYGVSRSFSSQITDGPQYAQQYLDIEKGADGAPVYKGPYTQGANGGFDEAITCPDDKTIVFKLNRPLGDFNYTVTMTQFAPVPKAKDTAAQYDKKLQSSGPYKIESYVKGKSITLVRNPNWDKATDTIRPAYPDKVVATFGLDPQIIDSRLIADGPQDQNAIMIDSTVQQQNLRRVLTTPNLKARAAHGLDGFTRYLAVNWSKVPDLKVRQAIAYAIDKETYRGTRGGADAGDYATSLITPALTSYKKFDPFPAGPKGDPEKAKALLAEAGKPDFPLAIDYGNTPQNAKSAAAFKAGLERAGFKVTLNGINPDTFYTTVGKTSAQSELTLAGWGPDWPSGSSVVPPLVDGRQIVPEGNQILCQCKDEEILAAIDKANAETDPAKQAQLWGDADEVAAKKVATVPLIFTKTTQMWGSKVKGAFLHAFYGSLDLATLSVN